MGKRVRLWVKGVLPGVIWRILRDTKVVATRNLIWLEILTNIRGCEPLDQKVLRVSALSGARLSFRDSNEWSDPVLQSRATLVVRGHGTFAVRPHCDDLYHVTPSRERAISKKVMQIVREGDFIVDAGANIGFHTISAARRVGNSGKVIAIEMMPDTARQLRHNLALNKLTSRVQVVECALSDRSGDMVEAHVPDGLFGQASLINQPSRAVQTYQVTTRTLDDILADETKPIKLLKLDLEGSERLALRGAKQVLARTHHIIFEQLPDTANIDDMLATANFALERLDARNWLAINSAFSHSN